MIRPILSLSMARRYAAKIMAQSLPEHHHSNVELILPTVISLVLAYADTIEVNAPKGELGLQAWMRIRDRRYSLRYEWQRGRWIEIRSETRRGPILYQFSNATPVEDVLTAFQELGR